ARTQHKARASGAGEFGYLRPNPGFLPTDACGPANGGGVAQALATNRLRMCVKLSGVHLLPSSDQDAMDGLNTRFDIYANSFNSCLLYAPDQNVRKGYTAPGNVNWCSAAPAGGSWPIDGAALPPDENMIVPDPDGNPVLDRN